MGSALPPPVIAVSWLCCDQMTPATTAMMATTTTTVATTILLAPPPWDFWAAWILAWRAEAGEVVGFLAMVAQGLLQCPNR